MARHLLSMFDLTPKEIDELMERSAWLKARQKSGKPHRPLEGKTLGMVFEKSSTRTRVSFEVGTFQLGGHALNLTDAGQPAGPRRDLRGHRARAVALRRRHHDAHLRAGAAWSAWPRPRPCR